MIWNEKKWYDGEWLNGHFEGQGVLCSNNLAFAGSFKNDKKQGLGILLKKNSGFLVGWYKENELDKDCPVMKVKGGYRRYGRFSKRNEFEEENVGDRKELDKMYELHKERLESILEKL